MKSGIECSQDILALLEIPSILDIITGDTYLFQQPENSKLQNLVVGTLVITNDQMQQGVINVNFHCPNLTTTIGGNTDTSLPDIAKMQQICSIVVGILNNYRGLSFFCMAQNTGIPLRDESNGNWFMNVRVNYYAFQDNYTNI